MATIDGNLDLGVAVTVMYNPNETAQQINEFFGINGQQTIFGGTRGATLNISGVFVGEDIADVNAAEAQLLTYADGNTHTVVDDRGREFDNVVFRGSMQPDSAGVVPWAGGGWAIAYRAVMQVIA